MCDTYTEQQVAVMVRDLDRLDLRDERILLGTAIGGWVLTGGCYIEVAYAAFHANGPLTTAFGIFGTAIGGCSYKVFKVFKGRRARRRDRNNN
ncbi:hypothetical protein [Streptomyces hyaluromycini]|uniref:hypothetical protein n=1 Tax=Streptomyces hyaluromycini TaxID=1377993 RepID=UPI0011AEA9E5|nr:hypothetical protein [Streptomyces hyaluromycini]